MVCFIITCNSCTCNTRHRCRLKTAVSSLCLHYLLWRYCIIFASTSSSLLTASSPHSSLSVERQQWLIWVIKFVTTKTYYTVSCTCFLIRNDYICVIIHFLIIGFYTYNISITGINSKPKKVIKRVVCCELWVNVERPGLIDSQPEYWYYLIIYMSNVC